MSRLIVNEGKPHCARCKAMGFRVSNCDACTAVAVGRPDEQPICIACQRNCHEDCGAQMSRSGTHCGCVVCWGHP